MLVSMKFHHIGVAVKSIPATATVYVAGGYKQSETIYDPEQGVNICWLTKDDMPTVELLQPVDESSPVNKTLEKNGVNPYHTCYIVDNIDQAISDLRKLKYVLVSKPMKAVAIHGCRVSFLYNKDVGLIEIVEGPAGI